MESNVRIKKESAREVVEKFGLMCDRGSTGFELGEGGLMDDKVPVEEVLSELEDISLILNPFTFLPSLFSNSISVHFSPSIFSNPKHFFDLSSPTANSNLVYKFVLCLYLPLTNS